jgi:hypothetical protein
VVVETEPVGFNTGRLTAAFSGAIYSMVPVYNPFEEDYDYLPGRTVGTISLQILVQLLSETNAAFSMSAATALDYEVDQDLLPAVAELDGPWVLVGQQAGEASLNGTWDELVPEVVVEGSGSIAWGILIGEGLYWVEHDFDLDFDGSSGYFTLLDEVELANGWIAYLEVDGQTNISGYLDDGGTPLLGTFEGNLLQGTAKIVYREGHDPAEEYLFQ